MNLRFIIIATLLSAFELAPNSQCFAQGSFRFITFDGPPLVARGSGRIVSQYFEGGMWFRAANTNWNTFTRMGGGVDGLPENGTAYLQAELTDSLSFGFNDGSAFDLQAVDLAEYSTVVPDARTVYFIGYRHDGTIVTNVFTTDGIIDGTGPIQDFQTFQFSSDMRNLDRVDIPIWSYGWSLDNLVVSTPEPSAASLLVCGGLAWWFVRRKFRSAANPLARE